MDFRFLVIVPAREGSKRFPGKNSSLLDGIPLFLHSLNFAKEFFDAEDIWLNTDDHELALIGESLSYNVYYRDSDLGSDYTPTVNVLKDQLESFKKSGRTYDAVVLLQPTNPLRKPEFMEAAIQLFLRSDRESLATFSPLKKKFGKLTEGSFYRPSNYMPGQRSQDLEELIFENGNIYISSSASIMKGEVISKDVWPLVIDDPYAEVDIDYPEDLDYAEYLIKKSNGK